MRLVIAHHIHHEMSLTLLAWSQRIPPPCWIRIEHRAYANTCSNSTTGMIFAQCRLDPPQNGTSVFSFTLESNDVKFYQLFLLYHPWRLTRKSKSLMGMNNFSDLVLFWDWTLLIEVFSSDVLSMRDKVRVISLCTLQTSCSLMNNIFSLCSYWDMPLTNKI